MLPVRKESLLGTFVFVAQALLLLVPSQAQLRKIRVADRMPEFSATDIDGHEFNYRHGGGRVLMVVFLSAGQERSSRAAADIERIVLELGANAESLQVAAAVSDPNVGGYFQTKEKESRAVFHILLDTEYKLWGKFGIIATPTVIISDTNDTVLWVKAGYGYDFTPVIRARLNQALGIAQQIDPDDASRVRTITNATVAARIKRHLQMAKILQQKGRLESAIVEVRKAQELDPNSVEVVLELGELCCRAGQSKAALDVVKKVKATKQLDRARLLLISGWAKRQMGELDAAEKLLLEATTLDPKSSRAFFELGKIYQARGQTDKAMMSYYKALAQLFGEAQGTETSHKQQEQSVHCPRNENPKGYFHITQEKTETYCNLNSSINRGLARLSLPMIQTSQIRHASCKCPLWNGMGDAFADYIHRASSVL